MAGRLMASTEDDKRDQAEDSNTARLDKLEGKVDQILGVLARFTGGPPADHATAQHQTEDRLDRPSSVAEQVRAELAKAEREAAAARAADDDKTEKEQTRSELAEIKAKLSETKPEPPQPRRQRVMWGAR